MLLTIALSLLAVLDGDAAFNAGREAYDQLEYEQAVFRFQEVAIRSDLDADDRATAFVWLGMSYAGVGDAMAAQRAFTDAIRARPDQVLPIEVSPKIEAIFADAKANMPPPDAAGSTTTPDPTVASPADGDSLPLVLTTASVGATLVVVGAGLGALCAATFAQASDPNAFQADAKSAVDAANIELAAASVLVPAGLLLGGIAGYVFAQDGP